jgi:hypothetical protein
MASLFVLAALFGLMLVALFSLGMSFRPVSKAVHRVMRGNGPRRPERLVPPLYSSPLVYSESRGDRDGCD